MRTLVVEIRQETMAEPVSPKPGRITPAFITPTPLQPSQPPSLIWLYLPGPKFSHPRISRVWRYWPHRLGAYGTSLSHHFENQGSPAPQLPWPSSGSGVGRFPLPASRSSVPSGERRNTSSPRGFWLQRQHDRRQTRSWEPSTPSSVWSVFPECRLTTPTPYYCSVISQTNFFRHISVWDSCSCIIPPVTAVQLDWIRFCRLSNCSFHTRIYWRTNFFKHLII